MTTITKTKATRGNGMCQHYKQSNINNERQQ